MIWASAPTNGGLTGDLLVEGTFPPEECDKQLKTLIDEGKFNKWLGNLLHDNEAFDLSWSLRKIQEESLEHVLTARTEENKPAVIISAGTGAGKTEGFLFPLLNELTEVERRRHEGVMEARHSSERHR